MHLLVKTVLHKGNKTTLERIIEVISGKIKNVTENKEERTPVYSYKYRFIAAVDRKFLVGNCLVSDEVLGFEHIYETITLNICCK